MAEEKERKWAGTTFGNAWMHTRLIGMLRHADVRVFYAFTAVFVVPFCLLGKSGRGAFRYFRERHGYSRFKSLRMAGRNLWLFSQVVIDKFAMYAGTKFDVRVEGYEHYKQLEAQPEAFVQLSSHIGNYEVAGYTLTAHNKRFNALVFGGEKSTVMEERNRLLAKDNIRLIPVSDDMSHLFTINSALSAGECVSMPADRVFGSNKTANVTLLGAEAALPMGPFKTAVMRRLNVLAVNVMRTGSRQYTVFVTPLPYDHDASTAECVRQLASAYSAELDRMLRRYPEQWYNFFDFWK